jgi:hypothetical protein
VGVHADGEEAEIIHPKNARDATQTENEIFDREAQGEEKKCSQSESGSFIDVTVPFPLTKLRIFWSSRLMGGFVAEMRSGLQPRSSTGVGASGKACPRNRFGRGI